MTAFKPTQYMHQEKAILAADTNGIRERWFWGLRLLRDPQAMSARGGGLRHGVGPILIAEAERCGYRLSEREIQWRLQCARAYPTELQIRNAVTDFGAWRDLIQAGFPPFDAPVGEPLADHRTKEERTRDRNRALLDAFGDQGTLFPLDTFEPLTTTLKKMWEYAEQQEGLTGRFAARDRKRREYLQAMTDAVGGNRSRLWIEAHQAAFPELST